jgi:membrane protease YdiL (CAAX protease family)
MDSEEPILAPVEPPNRPGLAAVFSLLIFFAQTFAQQIVLGVFYAIEHSRRPALDLEKWLKDAFYDGTILSYCMLASMLVGVPLIVLAARRLGGNARDYLGLRWPSLRSLLGWLVLLVAFVAVTDGLTVYVRRDVVPSFMENAYDSAHPRVLIWLAVLVAAPISEELLFRGLLFGGLERSPLRPEGAALGSSLAWAALHLQYDLFGITSIFVAGLLLATARHYSRSTILCILLHAAMNLIATLELLASRA